MMNMVCVGTTFQLCHVIREGKGQCSSTQALQVLKNRWFSWAGHRVCDRGRQNRGVLQQYMSENAPLETPEQIGRV